jgi:hypothetical protein
MVDCGGGGGDNDHILLHEYIRRIGFLNSEIKILNKDKMSSVKE